MLGFFIKFKSFLIFLNIKKIEKVIKNPISIIDLYKIDYL